MAIYRLWRWNWNRVLVGIIFFDCSRDFERGIVLVSVFECVNIFSLGWWLFIAPFFFFFGDVIGFI